MQKISDQIVSTQDSIRKLKNRFFLPRYIREMKKIGIGGISGGNSVTLITEGDTFFISIISSIENAEKSINLETYIFSSDSLGWIIAEKLAAKAAQGVEVNVIYDSVGSIKASSQIFTMMRDSGVEVIDYHPFVPWRKYWGLSFRDHRKILVIDGSKAFIGGINIGKEYAGEKFGGGNWRDTHIMIEGPAVTDIQFFFMENWYRNGGAVMSSRLYFPEQKKAGQKLLMILCTNARRKVKPVHRSYISAMQNSRNSIYITNAYFIPDARIYRSLVKAAERGVDVRLLLPGVSDVPFVKYASRYLYKRYMKKGIRIFEYAESILHAKTAVIDGVWSTVGSSNLDRRSFRKNLEMNAVILDQEFGGKMEQVFLNDIKKSKEITLDQFEKRSLIEFFIEWLCYRFRNLF
ncbi:MAG TPA: cardiolipin synthase [Spirochaetota bacterium]|nr:cardiolipin synthase [Spirochaetota bacterium]HPS87022.1 cardiolipin synthase [Spirochaetota bacterium]